MRTQHTQTSSNSMLSKTEHRSVLLQEVFSHLIIQESDVVLDATLGGGGHSEIILESLKSGKLYGIDADSSAIDRAKLRLERFGSNFVAINGNFRECADLLKNIKVTKITKAIFDLGWSQDQLKSGRGFSFLRDEPLIMSLSETPDALTAREIVNKWSEQELADAIFEFGEEKLSRKIAKAICDERRNKSIETTFDLVAIIESVIRFRGKIHPATRTFQALRILVNDELGAIRDGLNSAISILSSGGRIAVITFHSIEDRLVKNIFKKMAEEGIGVIITKHPVKPEREEVIINRRARSAKLRVFQKI